MSVAKSELRDAIVAALAPQTADEAAAIVDALDLYMAYRGRFAGVRDKRFSLIDSTPPDPRAYEASATIRERVVAVYGRSCAGARTLGAALRSRVDLFDTSDVEKET